MEGTVGSHYWNVSPSSCLPSVQNMQDRRRKPKNLRNPDQVTSRNRRYVSSFYILTSGYSSRKRRQMNFLSARWGELVWRGSCFALFHLAILPTSTRHRAYIFRHRLNDKQELPQCFTTALLMWKCVDIVLCSEDFLRSVSLPLQFFFLFPKPLCQDKRCTLCDRPSCLINSADSPISR